MPQSDFPDFKLFPKIELHRHLEGSLRVDTLQEILSNHDLGIPIDHNIQRLVQVHPDEPQNMSNFLSKFNILRLFYQSPEIIRRMAYEVIADASLDGIRYIEMMFTPVALSRIRSFPLDEVMDWVIESTRQASRDYNIPSRLIVSVNRHESPDLAAKVANLAALRLDKGIVAINLAGNEADFPAAPFTQIFNEARSKGLAITIHAGEWNGAENVREAIQDLKAARIGHGVRVLENPQVIELARQSGIPFEVCLTSNLQTGAISPQQSHPVIQMLESGLNVTLNTDDPGISHITLSDEFALAHQRMGITCSTLAQCTLAAARAAFLPADQKQALVNQLQIDLNTYLS